MSLTADDLQQFDWIMATFQPTRTDNLKPGSEKWIGRRMLFEIVWGIDDGPYEGDWAALHYSPPGPEHFGWVPVCDLQDIEMAPSQSSAQMRGALT